MAHHNLGVLDLVILIGSMALSAIIGFYFTNKNKSMDAYMLGDRRMSVIPVAVSLMSSSMSGLSILGSSSELYYQGPSYAFVAISLLLCGPVIAYTVLPVFYRMNELSLYKMIFFNAVVLYVPSMALQSLLGIERIYSILLIGILCVFYSGIGGIKAVVWTDLFQAFLMYASIITVGIVGTIQGGGFSKVFNETEQGGRFDLSGFFSLDLTTRHTFVGLVIGSTIKQTYMVGVNQVQIQRAISLPTLKQSQYSFMFCSFFAAILSLLVSYLGVVLYSDYRSCDPFLAGEIPRRDAIIVHYVANRLHNIPGLRGMFIAGLFSATLSTLSSFANSMAAVTMQDFIKPACNAFKLKPLDSKTCTWLSKVLSLVFGLICVSTAYIVDKANSRLLQATTTMFGAIGVPFLASFILGIYTRYINKYGIIAGFIVTLSLGSYLTVKQVFFNPPLEPIMPIFYDERCANVLNGTGSPDELPTFDELYGSEPHEFILSLPKKPASLDQISYMVLPIVQFALTFMISSIVSLLTGGWTQQVDRKYLAEILHSSDGSSSQSYNLKSSGDGKSSHDIYTAAEQRKRKLGITDNNFRHNKSLENCD